MKTLALKPVDAVWLMMESADTPMHVGVLAIFTMPAGAPDDYVARLAAKMREHPVRRAPWNYRLAGEGLTGMGPGLVEVRDVDLNYHFQQSALPGPGGERELGIMVSRLHSAALDRNRPLWELHLIEGLENRRFALFLKIHHALVSDVNAISLAFSMLSTSSRRQDAKPLWALSENQSGVGSAAADEALNSDRQSTDAGVSLSSLGQAGLGMLKGMISPRTASSYLLPRAAPRSTLNRPINQQRRFATQQFSEQRIAKLAAATSSTVNELLTYLCGTSLRRFFKEYNALPEASLVGLIPVSLQERSGHISGNAITGIRVELGTQIGNPLARLAAVKASIKTVREDRASLPDEAVTPYVLLRAAPLIASQLPGVGRFVPPAFNLRVSNTIGTGKPRYIDGAKLESIYPVSQLMQYAALSIDCVNYAGTLNIGFTGARDTLPHLQRMAVYMGQAVTDLEELVRKGEVAA